jgi:hypothetical protein
VNAPIDARLEVTFSDDAPLVDRLGQASWWVTPGTALELDVPAEVGVVHLSGLVSGPDVPAEARRGSSPPVRLERVGSTFTGTVPAGTGPVAIRSPADGPAVLLESAWTEMADGAWYLRGSRRPPFSASLFGTVDAEAPPPDLETMDRPVTAGRGEGRWIVGIDGLTAPPEATVRGEAGAACTPVQVHHDGKPLQPESWSIVFRAEHLDLVAAAPGVVPPATVRFAYNADRRCRGQRGLWLYPGDVVRVAPKPNAVETFRHPMQFFQLSGVPFGEPGPLRYRLRTGAHEVSSGTVEPGAWAGAIRHPLPAPLLYPADAVEIELALESGLLLLLGVDLVEADRG